MVKGLFSYAANLWSARHFWLMLARLDLQARYRRSSLGIGWSLLNPLAMTVVVCIVFHRILHQDVLTYAPFLMVGLSFWSYVCHVVLQGCHSFHRGQQYLRQHPLPAAVYPLTTVLTGGFHFLVALSVVLVFNWSTRGFGNIPYLLAVVPSLALLFALGWALAILAGLCNVFFPDTMQLTDVGLRMAFFLTPVLYPPHVVNGQGLEWFVKYNPLAACLELLRAPILDRQLPSPASFGVAVAGLSILSGIASVALAKLESKLVFHL